MLAIEDKGGDAHAVGRDIWIDDIIGSCIL